MSGLILLLKLLLNSGLIILRRIIFHSQQAGDFFSKRKTKFSLPLGGRFYFSDKLNTFFHSQKQKGMKTPAQKKNHPPIGRWIAPLLGRFIMW